MFVDALWFLITSLRMTSSCFIIRICSSESTLVESLVISSQNSSIEMLPPPTPTLQQSRPPQSVSMAPPTTPAAAEFGTPGTTACAADYSYGSCAPRADAPTALGAQEPNVMTPGEACSASLHERNQQFKARLAKMGGRRGR